VRVALRQRESLAVLRVRDDVIVLQTLLWPDEIRAAEFDVLSSDVDLRPQELTMAASLIESLAADFDPTQYTDAYQVAVRELVEAKLEGVAPPAVSSDEAGSDADVVDLLTALQRSVERARASRGEPAGEPIVAEKPPAEKKAARKSAGDASSSAAPATPATPATPAKQSAPRTRAPRKSA
jgi:DNA end-binding protein Ku